MLVDPSQGAPFIYVRTSDGFMVYSTGPNGVDDGGSCESRLVARGLEIDEDGENWKQVAFQLGLDISQGPDVLAAVIPEGADDIAIRLPLPKVDIKELVAAP